MKIPAQLRPIHVVLDVNSSALGSVMYCAGKTKILATLSQSDVIPRFLKDTPNSGWLTAEYAMLPASTHSRSERDHKRAHGNGRGMEIQRLIGRALRTCVDLSKLPSRKTLTLDCDVVQADGSTRTNAINAAMIALVKGIQKLQYEKIIQEDPLRHMVAAVSVGIYQGVPHLDLDYAIDSVADCDVNVVMNEHGSLIEIQGSSERRPIARAELDQILDVAWVGISEIMQTIRQVVQS